MADAVFYGPSALAMDAKGRFAMPTRHRDALMQLCAGRLTLTKDRAGCLMLIPEPTWLAMRDALLKLPLEAASWRRFLLGSALDVELDGAGRLVIAPELRALMGNRIYGCDDCQLICPWNKFARRSELADFDARAALVDRPLAALFAWSEADFLHFTQGSPIRRIGHLRWLRNIAVALGNALRVASALPETRRELAAVLQTRLEHPSPLVREHVVWALEAVRS